jgi:hypothetical protein
VSSGVFSTGSAAGGSGVDRSSLGRRASSAAAQRGYRSPDHTMRPSGRGVDRTSVRYRADVVRRDLRRIAPRAVLVSVRGIWTGRLSAWERIDGTWHGHAVWEADLDRRSGVVQADRLRPFELRWVEVQVFGTWSQGQLIGWRRRPTYYWEGCVQSCDLPSRVGPPEWFHINDIRPPGRPPPGFSDSF